MGMSPLRGNRSTGGVALPAYGQGARLPHERDTVHRPRGFHGYCLLGGCHGRQRGSFWMGLGRHPSVDSNRYLRASLAGVAKKQGEQRAPITLSKESHSGNGGMAKSRKPVLQTYCEACSFVFTHTAFAYVVVIIGIVVVTIALIAPYCVRRIWCRWHGSLLVAVAVGLVNQRG